MESAHCNYSPQQKFSHICSTTVVRISFIMFLGNTWRYLILPLYKSWLVLYWCTVLNKYDKIIFTKL